MYICQTLFAALLALALPVVGHGPFTGGCNEVHTHVGGYGYINTWYHWMNSTTLLGTSSSSTTSSSNTTVQEDDGEIVYVTVTTVITIPNPATTMAVQQNTTSITVTSSSVQLTVQAQSLLSESPIKTITIDAPSSLALVGVQNCSTTTNLADEQFDSSTSLLSLTDAFTTSVTSSDGYGNTPARATSV